MSPVQHMLVDANIARSATDPARHDVSRACLLLARELQDRSCATGVAMTPLLHDEWREHASPFMTAWLAGMESRNRVHRLKDRPVRDFRRVVAKVPDDGIRRAISKDRHITEAAIAYGLPVASRDERQRRYLGELSREYGLLTSVRWLNPEDDPRVWRPWLRAGCLEREGFCCTPVARA